MKNILFYIAIFFLNSAIAQVSDFKDIDFTIADNTAMLHEGKSLENLPVLAHHLTSHLKTDVEKFRAIYTWVCKNIQGDGFNYTSLDYRESQVIRVGYIQKF